ncbi:hypothetical protein [Brunnivagina elsteri]|uniref:Uncharacterized protein n=1 Tax=Brunnivagina elsteri CCALA 953 TaxID=987040 RepID=A0A2A2TI57_9CYAN|nr:hypothetical protein [Calothrix elsteri]PAX53487.1 hypothetical protein CK510_13700 [Calothrix elsteri CCALA 953]
MANPFIQKPAPYLFKGGDASDYEVVTRGAGTWCTRHKASGETIQSVQPGGLDMLNIANLGLNILNLGVGIYNATQLRKLKKKLERVHEDIHSGFEDLEKNIQLGVKDLENKLDRNQEQIQSYFNSIHNALSVQHRTLELLVSNQNNFAENMIILREEMRTGFQDVVEEVKDIEALRKREEFETRTFKLLKVYERFTYMLPELLEADQLIERAEDLEAWLRTQLNRIEIGKAERLPLFVALAFSVRAKADAFEAKGGNYSSFATKDITLLINEICSEAYAFCQGRSLYDIAVAMPEILYQYVLLNRSLRKGLEFKKQHEFDILFSSDEIIWDDSLDNFRKLFKHAIGNIEIVKGKEFIPLRTIDDYDWYIRFIGEDRLTFNIHSSRSAILLSEILHKLGHPNPQDGMIEKKSINLLMNFALPEASKKISHLIKNEFSLDKYPQLMGCGDS